MDRKTAIELIEQIKHRISGGDEVFDRQRKEALDMAIVDMKICDANNAGWISVKDRLPDEDADVLVFNRLGIEVAAYTTNPTKRWYGMSGNTVYAQYWMPLPEPPKEG